jgi:hypothetical protein
MKIAGRFLSVNGGAVGGREIIVEPESGGRQAWGDI